VDYDVAGSDFTEIKAAVGEDSANAQYHFTGPAGFMEHAKALLLSSGVRADQLYYETYGPM
jgi:ferredoxin-NADP reductase